MGCPNEDSLRTGWVDRDTRLPAGHTQMDRLNDQCPTMHCNATPPLPAPPTAYCENKPQKQSIHIYTPRPLTRRRHQHAVCSFLIKLLHGDNLSGRDKRDKETMISLKSVCPLCDKLLVITRVSLLFFFVYFAWQTAPSVLACVPPCMLRPGSASPTVSPISPCLTLHCTQTSTLALQLHTGFFALTLA